MRNKQVKLNLNELSNTSGVIYSHDLNENTLAFNIDPDWTNNKELEFTRFNRIYKQYNNAGVMVRLFGYIKGDK